MSEFVVDTSVIVAIVLRDSGWAELTQVLAVAERIAMCTGTVLECELVLLKKSPVAVDDGEFWPEFQKQPQVHILDFDRYRLNIAKQALKDFGSGRHRLNFGDCYAYSLAKSLGLPLLFKGQDFAATDVKRHPASVVMP